MSNRDRCNFCGDEQTQLAKDKLYCIDCAVVCSRECVVCHKPYPNLDKFQLNNSRCNSCQRRLERRKMMKKQESSEEMVREGEKMSTSSTLPHSSEVGDMDDDDNVLPMKKRKRRI